MNKDILQGKWKQLRGMIQERWGQLTSDEIDQVAGRYNQLVNLIQAKYGYARDQAMWEVDAFLEEVENRTTAGA
jgi:uncharacterized protein YjbJ (UPF0337 family)